MKNTAQTRDEQDAILGLGDGLPSLGRPEHFTGHDRFEIQESVNAWLDKHRTLSVTQIDLGLTGGGDQTTLGYVLALWAKPQERPSSERVLKVFEDTPHSSYAGPGLDTQLGKYLDEHCGYKVVKSATACAGEYGKTTFAVAEAILLERR